jgi:hypothetical protein
MMNVLWSSGANEKAILQPGGGGAPLHAPLAEDSRPLILCFLALFVILASLWYPLNALPQRRKEHQGHQELQKHRF